jgi:hypothetical protein
MWKQHIGVCTALALVAIPIYIADKYLLMSGVISIVLLVVASYYSGYDRASEAADYEKRMETIQQLRKAIRESGQTGYSPVFALTKTTAMVYEP